ncbi:MAG: GAF domain-containing protein, partial [Thermomicrobiales bacterium]
MSEPATEIATATTTSAAGLFAVLRDVVARFRQASGADILSLYLYDADVQAYYAPVASGLPEEDLAGSLSDMHDQLAHYLADVAQGKAPAELLPTHYGPNVWLTVTRQRLYAKDAPKEIDSSFIRRFHIQSVLGLPLLAGDRVVGLLYL